MTTCPRIYTVRVHPVSKMVRVMPTETETTKAQPTSPIIAPRQEMVVLTACMRSKDVREDVLPMLIEDKANVTIGDIRATAARMIRGAERGLIVIDYLQLISSASDGARFQNRAVEVGEISRRLKVLAKELGVPVVTLAQLSRQAEGHPGVPRLSDLRESGSIEQDADTVLFLSRDPDEIKDERSGSRQVILSIAKNRSGPTGDIDMLFVPTSTKFYEVGPRKENRDD